MEGLRPFSRYFDFSGRSGRAEFWQFTGLLWVALAAAFLFEAAIGDEFGVLSSLIVLVTFIPQVSVTVRRLHDTGNTGWMILGIYAVMFLGLFFIFLAASEGRSGKGLPLVVGAFGYYAYLMIKRGDDEGNKYGAAPGSDAEDYPAYVESSAASPSASSQPENLDNSLSQIERLGSLRNKGLLSEEEFTTQKAAILAKP